MRAEGRLKNRTHNTITSASPCPSAAIGASRSPLDATRHDTMQRATADGKRTANSLRRRALHRLDVIGFWRC